LSSANQVLVIWGSNDKKVGLGYIILFAFKWKCLQQLITCNNDNNLLHMSKETSLSGTLTYNITRHIHHVMVTRVHPNIKWT